ncbi:MAG: hypothetical protein AMJ46_11555 [Latescibacteria bacterium DG_63]|nr:MAG: hypothetical protein AMJ46_11555 [Latescibacteria bacterium DG_63]
MLVLDEGEFDAVKLLVEQRIRGAYQYVLAFGVRDEQSGVVNTISVTIAVDIKALFMAASTIALSLTLSLFV